MSIVGDLVYFGDPMCSWCYGFAPEIEKLKNQYKDQLSFRLVLGGLRPYGKETMNQLSDMLKHHWEEVGIRSGQKFKYDLLDQSDFVYDTEPPSRATVVMRYLKPELEFSFFKRIQEAFYAESMDTNKVDNYMEMVEEFGISPSDFKDLFEQEELKTKTAEDFEYAQQLGIRGFPTTVLFKDQKGFLLSNGYRTSELISESIDKILSEETA